MGRIAVCLSLSIVVMLPARPGFAQEAPLVTLNAGLNDAWINPETPGQGFFVTVYPDISFLFLGWFTYDTERPAESGGATIGEPGHRWITAEGFYAGNSAELEVILTRGGLFDAGQPTPESTVAGTIHVMFETCAAGLIRYDIPDLGLEGEIPVRRIANDNIARCETQAALACQRAKPDPSHGPNNPQPVLDAIVPRDQIISGGPGPDGIPPIEAPVFTQDFSTTSTLPDDRVVGIKNGDDVRAYPYHILWWHEVVNDAFSPADPFTLSYCPLTGTSMLWKTATEPGDKTFGTSGRLYNSNLVMYDRFSGTFWSQMLEQAVVGSRVTTIPLRAQVVETTWQTWQAMYPDTVLLTEETGFSRDYRRYPYGDYRTDDSLLFPTNNSEDQRLHRKARVVGINVGSASKVYPLDNFTASVEAINDTVGGMPVVVAGSRDLDIGVVYNRETADCTVLEFEAVQDRLPVILRDNEGNEWDVFGNAVSGPRTGQQLQKTNSYVSFWFAWTAFFPHVEIHQ